MLKLNLKTDLPFLLSHQKLTLTPVNKFFSSAKARVCYYDILGVRTDATQHDIKQAYYEKVKMFHPDQSHAPEAEEKFKIVAKAYETLKDPISRQNYDIERIRPVTTYSYNGHTTYSSYYSSGMKTDAVQYEYRQYESEEYREKEYNATVYEKSVFSEYTSTNFLIKLCLGIGALIILDMWWRPKKPARKVVAAEDATLAVGSLVFESPLVFVRDKPVDPVKLQEEIKQKQFRIEYIESPGKHSITAAKEKRKWKTHPKAEKRIADLDEFVASRGQKLERKEDNQSL